jgi:integrase
LRSPPDPPTVEEIIAVTRAGGENVDGLRLRGLIVVLWRAGLRISEALALTESDLEPARGAILVRRGKGGKRREVGMDRWAWEQLAPWLSTRAALPVGALFCVLRGPTRGRPARQPPSVCSYATRPRRLESADGSLPTSSATPTPSRCHAKGCPMVVIQRQLGHAHLGITSVYLRGIDNTEIIHTVHQRPAPMIPAINGLAASR